MTYNDNSGIPKRALPLNSWPDYAIPQKISIEPRMPPSFFREPVDVIEYEFKKRRMILKEDNEILEILAAIMPSLN